MPWLADGPFGVRGLGLLGHAAPHGLVGLEAHWQTSIQCRRPEIDMLLDEDLRV